MDRSAIVLAEDFSGRFGEDKGFLELEDKPLIRHVLDAVSSIVGEVILVTDSLERADKYAELLGSEVTPVVDKAEKKGYLTGVLAGFSRANGKYSLLLASDMPFVSSEVVELLFDLCYGKSAVIPRWPNQHTELLHAVYRTEVALEAARQAVTKGMLDMDAFAEAMHGVRYVSTLVVQELDPELKTLFRVNTPVDLKKAAIMTKPKPRKRSKPV
jgi:molybdopterin-guanine dinucleotide biosynthesis protein A